MPSTSLAVQTAAFVLVSAFLVYVSRRALFQPHSHGFFRFFAWECILALIVLNAPRWGTDPFSALQLVSWLFLLLSIFLVVHGVRLLKLVGKPDQTRPDSALLAFERTSRLVTVGAYRYIRHPLYSSLLFLAWGAFFKDPSPAGVSLALAASVFLLLTAKQDESECLLYFGDAYRTYMKGTRRFVPFLF